MTDARVRELALACARAGHEHDRVQTREGMLEAALCGACARAEVGRLTERVREQRRQLETANRSLRDKNRALDAMHYVWCSGGCWDGAHRWHGGKISEAVVAEAERNTRRLRAWFENAKSRIARCPDPTKDEAIKHLRRLVDTGDRNEGAEDA